VQSPAKDIHITPGIYESSLISTSKMEDAGYIAVFDKDSVKMYDAYNTQVIITRDEVINGWHENKTGMWQVALVPVVQNLIPTPFYSTDHQQNSFPTAQHPSKISSCHSWISHTNNMAESDYEQAIFILAGNNSRSSPKALPRIRGDTQGTLQRDAKWAAINQTETTS
jgi:hypothetical protein